MPEPLTKEEVLAKLDANESFEGVEIGDVDFSGNLFDAVSHPPPVSALTYQNHRVVIANEVKQSRSKSNPPGPLRGRGSSQPLPFKK